MRILSPYSRPLRNGKNNPKNYPWFAEVIALTPEIEWVQIGTAGETRIAGVKDCQLALSLPALKVLVEKAEGFLSVDNFFPHFVALYCSRLRGVVVWGKSNPKHFGYPQNQNLSLEKFRAQQWKWYEDEEFDPLVFLPPETVANRLR